MPTARPRPARVQTLALALALLAGAAPVFAEDPILPVIPTADLPLAVDSGLVSSAGALEDEVVVFATTVQLPGAEWMRLNLAGTELAGDPAAEGARLRITSLRDGGVQVLNGEHLGFWSHTSAYFNGDAVLVEVLAHGGTGASRLTIAGATVGLPNIMTDRTICGSTDDRVLSSDPRQGRLMTVGCTAWLFNDFNKTFLTAGHCTVSTTSVVQFNVPLSTATGATVAPAPQHQYPADVPSNQGVGGGVGADWRYFACNVNANTGLTAYQAQNAFYNLAPAAPAVTAGSTITITGYGTTASPISPTWNQVQKIHSGPYVQLTGTTVRYATDTTGGNSGSPILHDQLAQAIGIHTHAGCSATAGTSNQGTAIQYAPLQAGLNNPLGICRSGRSVVASSDIRVMGDAANNFGKLNTTTGAFDALAALGSRVQGLTYNPATGLFYAIDTNRVLYTVDEANASIATLGTVTGTTLTITGLAYDSAAGVLYGSTSSNGQLWRINTGTLAATTASSPLGYALGALEFDPVQGVLWGLDDNAAAGTRLIRITQSTGAMALVGVLGAGINDCNGLAVTGTGALYTINATNDNLYQVDPATGAATLRGATLGAFGAQFGMSGVYTPACDLDFNNDGLFPDTMDIDDFLAVFSGSPCPTAACDAIDFNGDGLFPDTADIDDFLIAFSGGPC